MEQVGGVLEHLPKLAHFSTQSTKSINLEKKRVRYCYVILEVDYPLTCKCFGIIYVSFCRCFEKWTSKSIQQKKLKRKLQKSIGWTDRFEERCNFWGIKWNPCKDPNHDYQTGIVECGSHVVIEIKSWIGYMIWVHDLATYSLTVSWFLINLVLIIIFVSTLLLNRLNFW